MPKASMGRGKNGCASMRLLPPHITGCCFGSRRTTDILSHDLALQQTGSESFETTDSAGCNSETIEGLDSSIHWTSLRNLITTPTDESVSMSSDCYMFSPYVYFIVSTPFRQASRFGFHFVVFLRYYFLFVIIFAY